MDFGHVAGVALTSAVVSGVVVAVVSDYLQGRRREADVREARRNEGARIVGPALAGLRDLEPEGNVGGLRGHQEATRILQEKWERWLSAAGELEVLGAKHPETAVDRRCQSVIADGTALMTGIHAAVTLGAAIDQQEWERLKRLHGDSLTAARALVKDVLAEPA
jgi:hypothetical protein